MISTGIFTGYYPYTLEETIKRIKAQDFSCVQLDVSFKDFDSTKEPMTKEKAHWIRDAFRDANLPIIAVSAYTNFIHPDPVKRQANIDYLKMMIRYARDLGCPYVASETGTYNEESDWVWDDRNGSQKVFDEAIAVIKDIAAYARDCGATFCVENYVNNTVGSVEKIQIMFDEVGHDGLALLCDPTNYFDDAHFADIDGTINEIFDKLGPYFKFAHAKDIKKAVDTGEKHVDIDADESHTFRGAGSIELPSAGLGCLNYDLYVKRLAELHPNIPLIIEHVDSEDDIIRAKKFVDGVLKKAGV